MSQPDWRIYETLGDRGLVLVDISGVYAPVAEIVDDWENEDGETRFIIHCFSLDKYTLGMIAKAWFYEGLQGVANSSGTTKDELVEALRSDNIMDRLWAYENIGGYFGLDNFDSYPLDLSEEEMDERERRAPKFLESGNKGRYNK